MKTKTFTVEQVIDAIELNGYEKSKGSYINDDGGNEIDSACALGQAALNLGISIILLRNRLRRIEVTGGSAGQLLPSIILTKNDETDATLPEIAGIIRALPNYAKFSQEKVAVPEIDYFIYANYQGVKIDALSIDERV